ncbi:hypothetical protein HRH25_09950 [Flavisolibacter sp. BT320]|nr:hypothetical protein [Flavisolibacter longurius]
MQGMLSALFLVLLMVAGNGYAQEAPTGPRQDQGKPVRLTPVSPTASSIQVQAMLDRGQDIYFGRGTYTIGTLRIKGGKSGLLWGAGRLTTVLQGSIIIEGTPSLTIGNFSLVNTQAPKGSSLIDIIGNVRTDITLMNTLISGNRESVGIRIKAPGNILIQGCNPKWADIGISIEHPKATVAIFGGNLQYNRIHIQQQKGHLDARAFGIQGTRGDADVVIQTPSPLNYHILEGIRSEGSNGGNPEEVFLQVPRTKAAVNVLLRANTLGSMVRYADYNANGKLVLLENVNYPGPEDKQSLGVKTGSFGNARVLSYGNKYGLSYDTAPGPFAVSASTTVQSMGDLWMLPNQTDYSKRFNEPITAAALENAGKKSPPNVLFRNNVVGERLPEGARYRVATLPRLANLAELMPSVTDYGAIPGDGKDDREAIQKAMAAAEKEGIAGALYFPTGIYELAEPLFLDHFAGGGFWGDGAEKTVLVSTSGKGVLLSDGAGYALFADIGFANRKGAESKTADFDWRTDLSPAKKQGGRGAALQANMFYRCRFENGSVGMAVGKNRMGDGFMMIDCWFRNHRTVRGEGAAYLSEGFNALTNPLVHCSFENSDHAVINAKGSFNFYGNRLANIQKAALKLMTVVGDGFAIVNNTMDASPVPFLSTGHSSSRAHILMDGVRVEAAPRKVPASSYALGGSVLILNTSFPNRTVTNGGGIGDNSLIILNTEAAEVSVSGRAHGYFEGKGEKTKR